MKKAHVQNLATFLIYTRRCEQENPAIAALPKRNDIMLSKLFTFFADQSGAVTVDWVVLTAGVVGLGIIVLAPIGSGASNMAASVGLSISNKTVGYTSTP